MFCKKLFSQTNQFRIFFVLCLVTIVLSYSFITILRNRTDIRWSSILNNIIDPTAILPDVTLRSHVINDSTTTLPNVTLQTHTINDSTTSLSKVNTTCVVDECTAEQRERHGSLFAQYPPQWSGCYADLYLSAFDNHSTPVDVLMDVGANKAFAVATWLAFFVPELGVNPHRLGMYIQTRPELSDWCGSCNDCRDEPINRTNIQKVKLKVYAFEPQPGTVNVLLGVKDWMNISAHKDLSFEVHGMAVSDHTGQVVFRKCNAGNEVCSLDVSKIDNSQQIFINSTSLDDFASQNQLPKIDILKIDTEGYEPLVFRGAQTLLKEHRIRLFIFEHLTEGVWRNTSMQIEVANLTKLGYICYMIGQSGLIRVSSCWNEKFQVRHCNLLCVSSQDRQLWKNIDRLRLPGSHHSTCQNKSIHEQ